jgi:hypothetical protein
MLFGFGLFAMALVAMAKCIMESNYDLFGLISASLLSGF